MGARNNPIITNNYCCIIISRPINPINSFALAVTFFLIIETLREYVIAPRNATCSSTALTDKFSAACR